MHPMRLAFVVGNYPPHLGGLENHVRSLAGELTRVGVRITVYNVEAGTRTMDGVPVIGLGRHFDVSGVVAFPSRGATSFLERDLTDRGITHVSTHTRFFPATWLGIKVARGLGLPVLLTEHGGGHVRTGGIVPRLGARVIDSTMGRHALRSATEVLAVSRVAADFVKAMSGRTAPVCGNGIDLPRWRATSAPRPRRNLVFAGRLVREKGWREFLAVAATMPRDVTALVAGDGPDARDVPAEVARLGLTGRVSISGEIPADRLRDQLAGSVYVNPSVAAEGFQTTLLEAAVAGARVATYPVGGSDEVFAGGVVGGIAPSGDVTALARIARQALDLEWIEPTLLERYSWPAVARVYLATLRGMVAR